jgi:membrane protein required for colicin V production
MNILDIIFIAVLLASTIMGLFRGATREIFSLGAIVCGIFGASRLYPKFTPYLAKYVSNPVLTNLLSFVIVFLVIAGSLMIISIILCKIWKILLLGWADRVAGALFGFVRGVVLIGVICALLSIFPLEKTKEMMENSQLLPSLSIIKEVLLSLFPFERILPK